MLSIRYICIKTVLLLSILSVVSNYVFSQSEDYRPGFYELVKQDPLPPCSNPSSQYYNGGVVFMTKAMSNNTILSLPLTSYVGYPLSSSTDSIRDELLVAKNAGTISSYEVHIKKRYYYDSSYNEGDITEQSNVIINNKCEVTLSVATEVASEIKSLAYNLKYDPKLMYEYVRNNIDIVFPFEASRDAYMTLVDCKGSSYDQATLLVALLREAEANRQRVNDPENYTYVGDIKFVYGEIELSVDEISEWLSIESNFDVIDNYLATVGVPFSPLGNNYILDHIWVSADILSPGNTVVFDPSYKSYQKIIPKKTLSVVMSEIGYSKESLIDDLVSESYHGGLTSMRYLQDVNVYGLGGLRDRLNTLCMLLIENIRENCNDVSLADIIGGNKIIEVLNEPYKNTLEYYNNIIGYTSEEIDEDVKTKLKIYINDIALVFNTEDVYGRSLTLDYSSNKAHLLLDNYKMASASSTESSGTSKQLKLTPVHGNVDSGLTVFPIVNAGGQYFIVNNWGYTGGGVIAKHQEKIQELKHLGFDDDDDEITQECLSILGLTWLAEQERYSEIVGEITNCTRMTVHILGVCGQYTGPYIDLPGGYGTFIDKTMENSDSKTAFLIQGNMASAFEWGIWDQLQNYSAASTIKLIDDANNRGHRLYDVSLENWYDTYYQSGIKTLIESKTTFSSSDLGGIKADCYEGYRMILPDNGEIKGDNWSSGDWLGCSYLAYNIKDKYMAGNYPISGGYNGGYSFSPSSSVYSFSWPSFTFSGYGYDGGYSIKGTSSVYVPNNSFNTSLSSLSNSTYFTTTFGDPVDTYSGHYLYNHTDLSIGNGGPAKSLYFSRTYNSGSGSYNESEIGNGWSHNLDITSHLSSSGFKVMGSNSPIEAVSSIVATFVAVDLISGHLDYSNPVLTTNNKNINSLSIYASDSSDASSLLNDTGITNSAHKNNAGMWSMSGTSGWVKVNLGDSYHLSSLGIYNYNELYHTDAGAKDVEIYYSENVNDPGAIGSGNWVLYGYYTLNQAPGSSDYGTNNIILPDFIDFEHTLAHWVYVKINNNYGDVNYVGLSELRFIESRAGDEFLPRYTMAAFTQKWLMDQMIDNTVTINNGSSSTEFVRLPDGTYNPPPGVAAILTAELNEDETFDSCVMHSKDGSVMNFNEDGLITEWSDGHENNVTYTYYTTGVRKNKVRRATNDFGCYIEVQYDNNGKIIKVLDSEGRFVTYEYSDNGFGNLTSFTDVNNLSTIYSYVDDNSTEIDPETFGLLESVKYPFNTTVPYVFSEYDSTGRVIKQTDAMGNSYDYYFTGFRSEEVAPPEEYDTDFVYDADGDGDIDQDDFGFDDTNSRFSQVTYYNKFGRITKQIDKMGRETNFEYDGQLRQKKVTAPNGTSTEYFYDENQNIVKVAHLSKTVFEIVSIQTGSETTLTLSVNEDVHQFMVGETVWIEDTAVGSGINILNSGKDQSEYKVTYVNGNQIKIHANTAGSVYAGGKIFHAFVETSLYQNLYNTIEGSPYERWFNLPVESVDNSGTKTSFEYYGPEQCYNLKKVSTRNENDTLGDYVSETTYSYYPDKNFSFVQTVTNKINNSGDSVTSLLIYDDELTGKGTYNLINTIDNYFGLEDERPIVTTAYTDLGQVDYAIDPLGHKVGYEYSGSGRLKQTIAENGVAVENVYSSTGQIDYVVTKESRATDAIILQKNSFTYTNSNKKKTVTDTLNRTSTYNYDNKERLHEVIDANNNSTYSYYYPDGSLYYTRNAEGHIVARYSYNPDGSVTSVTDANGNSTYYDYDYFGRQYKTTFSDATYKKTSFDCLGRVATETTRDGDVFVYEYDVLSRTEYLNIPGKNGKAAQRIKYVYDLLGRTLEVSDENDPANTLTTNYFDNLGRLRSVTSPDGKIVKYEYDLAGNRKLLQYPDHTDSKPSYVKYYYDNLNRLDSIEDDDGITIAKYLYDQLSRIQRINLENGTSTFYSYSNQATSNYTSGSSQLAKINIKTKNAIHKIEYTDYDNVGNLITKEVNSLPYSYSYDDIYQIKTADYPTNYFVQNLFLDYDPAGNRTSSTQGSAVSYTPNNLNQYATVGGATLLYDFNGNTTFDGYNTLTYDAENQLLSASYADRISTYDYDLFGRRSQKSVSDNGTVVTTKYLYDGNQVLCEYDGDGKLAKKFVYGPGIDSPIRMTICKSAEASNIDTVDINFLRLMSRSWLNKYDNDNYNPVVDMFSDQLVNNHDLDIMLKNWNRSSSEIEVFETHYYYYFDGSNNVIALADVFGDTVETYNYDAYGRVVVIYNPGPDNNWFTSDGVEFTNSTPVNVANDVSYGWYSIYGNPYYFTGRRLDSESGLYYYRARYYSPTIGRFLQTDPIGYSDGLNWYTYCGNNPVSNRDPLGLWFGWDDAIFAGVGAVTGIVGQAVSDAIMGELSGWETYAGAAVGGAVSAETLLYTGNPIAAGAAGGATSNVVTQGLQMVTGEREEFSYSDLAISTTSGALFGGIGGQVAPVQGVTAGRNSFAAITKQIVTKGKNGTINSISRSTAVKMSVGNFTAEVMSYSYLGKVGSDVTNRTLDSFVNPKPMETVSFGSDSGRMK